jgi:hypothetical protein
MNDVPTRKIYYAKARKFSRYMAHLVAGIYFLGALFFLRATYLDSFFMPMLVLYIPIAIYTVAYAYAAIDTCIIVSNSGIEYQRPEFAVIAKWSEIKALKRSLIFSLFGLRYYLILEAPRIRYAKWFGTMYRIQPSRLLFRGLQTFIPLGNMWQDYEQLENELRTHVPSLSFDVSKNRKAG